ncbi:MAG: bifunctional riboflavin kinase/FAD synthetase [Chloroflexota bacterium]
MKIVSSLDELERGDRTVLTIGAFDGVHLGHQWLIRQVIERASELGYQSVVVTLEPRPEVVLRPGSIQLTDSLAKREAISALNPDVLAILPFNRETAAIPAADFLDDILARVNLAELWIGADFAFGHKRRGNADFLVEEGKRRGFAVKIVGRKELGETPISSTLVRDLVAQGEMERVTALLGRPFSLRGEVVKGFGRGKEMGFPTANLKMPEHQLVPATGIYAGRTIVDDEPKLAAVSIGYNPVFGNEHLAVEAHLLDFQGDLYGRTLEVQLLHRLREERSFSDVDALVAQIERDVEETRNAMTEETRRA